VSVSIHIDRNCDSPLYQQLYEQLKGQIERGELPANSRLPTLRELAAQLEVNVVTVVSAYRCLEQAGLVTKRVGSGTYVAQVAGRYSPGTEEENAAFSEDIRLMGQGQMQVAEGTINFATGTPTVDLFPVEEIKGLINEILDREKGNAFAYQRSQGYYPLREAIFHYLRQQQFPVDLGNILIVSGAQQGIDVLAKSFLRSGDTLAAESPTYTGAISAFKSRGATIVEAPIYPDGPDLRILATQLRKHRTRLIYVMPNFQNPTGYVYSREKKEALLRLASEHQALIIEDDCLSDLNFSGQDCTTLKAMDTENRVIYIKSFSKILMPGFRLAFLVVPPLHLNTVLAAKHTSDISTSGLTQMVFDLYLRKGLWPKHIERMKEIYRERLTIMARSLRRHCPAGIEYLVPGGGLSFWLSLPEGYSSDQFYSEAQQRGVMFTPGSAFLPGQQPSRFFRLSLAAVRPSEIERGVRLLCATAREFLGEKGPGGRGSDSYTPIL
jgi:2-aminoadipate transaminase